MHAQLGWHRASQGFIETAAILLLAAGWEEIELQHACRYIPAVDDAVVGIIKERYGESWTLDIQGPFPATLPALAFEGVTRRNRPRLEAGDVVYAKVTNAPRDADTELTCVLATGKVRLTVLQTSQFVSLDHPGRVCPAFDIGIVQAGASCALACFVAPTGLQKDCLCL